MLRSNLNQHNLLSHHFNSDQKTLTFTTVSTISSVQTIPLMSMTLLKAMPSLRKRGNSMTGRNLEVIKREIKLNLNDNFNTQLKMVKHAY